MFNPTLFLMNKQKIDYSIYGVNSIIEWDLELGWNNSYSIFIFEIWNIYGVPSNNPNVEWTFQRLKKRVLITFHG